MRLLIVTQAVDSEDPVLGFFVRWIEELAKRVESIEVICLKMGECNFPKNVRVHSLGKERGRASRAAYAARFLALAWRARSDYDAVLVHMNQEYVLMAGWLWKLLGKRVYMWRNHYAGSWLTSVAAAFCTNIFCTSKHSYTAKYEKTILMPVGVDTERFAPDERVARNPRSMLFLARMAPSKQPEVLIDALAELARTGQSFTASFVGSPLPRDEAYYEGLKEKVRELGLADTVAFLPGVPNEEAPALYRAHEIFVNASPSGMLDKTLFEAAACGCLPLAASADWAEQAGEDLSFIDAASLARRLSVTLAYSPADIGARAAKLRSQVVERNSLARLGEALEKVMR